MGNLMKLLFRLLFSTISLIVNYLLPLLQLGQAKPSSSQPSTANGQWPILLRSLSAFFFLFLGGALSAQLNTTLLSHLPYEEELNDIWGYVSPDGTEYALVGANGGVSIVSLAEPSAPEEVAYVAGASSVWRDLKTYGDYAYVTTDQPNTEEGLLVIDLTGLPDTVRSYNWRPAPNETDTLNTCHNIYIDEFGVAYLAGCNLNRGGMLFVDVATAPGEPDFLGFGPATYSHDVYVQNNQMYASELLNGQLAIYDVTDKEETFILGGIQTPFRFTHNAWASPDGRYAFTTDERANAPVTAFDVSDPRDIIELDQYRPISTLGTDVIPHNVHVIDQFLAISYYTDGARIVDASRPDNLIEIAYYDTNDDFSSGFHGAWGLYPFLPSGIMLVTDIENGLYVLDVNYVHAAWLEGRVRDQLSSEVVRDVEVEIIADQPNFTLTDRLGDYRTGLALSGDFEAVFRHPAYFDKRVPVTLLNGEVTTLDVVLQPKPRYRIGGRTVADADGSPVAGATVQLTNEDFTYTAKTGADGRFELTDVIEGAYTLVAGAWGFLHESIETVSIENDASVSVALKAGYQDDFIFDLGWTAAGTAPVGRWERGIPDGTRTGSRYASPPADIDTDLGAECYVTGNGGGNVGDDDVDNGTALLLSPIFDLSGYEQPELSYHLWFFNDFGGSAPDDALEVRLTNGADTVLLETVTESGSSWRDRSTFFLPDLIALSNSMQLLVETSDFNDSGHVVEAAFDAFLVRETATTAVGDPEGPAARLQAFPNPFSERLRLDYELPAGLSAGALLRVFDTMGREVERRLIDQSAGTIELGSALPAGLYVVSVETGNRQLGRMKVVKVVD